ncbi:unnamed protein product [Dovyalis caffra]|uniref:Uncharacterized protein n=1 Tax=Dovyalis caffra TaxID=77055 RepID=A0AAV1RAP2_9ROSI|nr:unnamed protein product [Dovyalis caffra]
MLHRVGERRESSVDKESEGSIRVKDIDQKVCFEGLPQVCYTCGRMGYNGLFCSTRKAEYPDNIERETMATSVVQKAADGLSNDCKESSEIFGPWLHAPALSSEISREFSVPAIQGFDAFVSLSRLVLQAKSEAFPRRQSDSMEGLKQKGRSSNSIQPAAQPTSKPAAQTLANSQPASSPDSRPSPARNRSASRKQNIGRKGRQRVVCIVDSNLPSQVQLDADMDSDSNSDDEKKVVVEDKAGNPFIFTQLFGDKAMTVPLDIGLKARKTVAVYASLRMQARRILWGDFNAMLNEDEKIGDFQINLEEGHGAGDGGFPKAVDDFAKVANSWNQ